VMTTVPRRWQKLRSPLRSAGGAYGP
jgi:hypothetical protein